MKMKKIISLCVCAMMALSTVANAAYTTDEDGWYIADKVSLADVAARAPKAKVDVTELTAAAAKDAGLALGKGSSALTDDNSDFYQIDVVVSDLGDLMYAYLDGSDYGAEMQVRLYNAKVSLSNVVFKKIVTASTYNETAWTTSTAGNADNLLAIQWNSGGVDQCLPTRNPATGDLEGAYTVNPTLDKATMIIAVDNGAKFENITPAVQVTYRVVNDETTGKSVDANGTGNVVSIAPAAPAATLDRVVISGETTGLKMGATETTTLTAKAYNTDDTENTAAEITWSVDGDAVTVADGVVTAVKAGTATVTAKAVDGAIEKTASVVITVAEADPIVVTPSIKVIGADQTEADPTAAPGTAATGTVDGKEVKGFVWPLVKLINFNAAGTYRATFTAEDAETAERTFDFSGIEAGGKTDIEFAIVLNTNKTGVTLNMQYVAPSAE